MTTIRRAGFSCAGAGGAGGPRALSSDEGARAKLFLASRARAVLSAVFQLKSGQRVLIISDDSKASIADAFEAAAISLGVRTDRQRLTANRFDNGGIEEVEAKIRSGNYQACFNFIESRVAEVPYRVRLLKAEGANQGLILHSPGLTEEMLKIEVDYASLRVKAEKLCAALVGAEKVVITTARGTTVEIGVKGRPWISDLTAKPAAVTNIPNGEIYCPPVEDGAHGLIVVDGSIGGFGLVPSPLVIEVQHGKILSKDGDLVGVRWQDSRFEDKEDFLGRLKRALALDEGASQIGELGIGLAPFELIGLISQDEKAARTIHVAFGMNDFFGGTNNSRSHIDFLVKAPTLAVHYTSPDKPPLKIMDEGQLLVA